MKKSILVMLMVLLYTFIVLVGCQTTEPTGTTPGTEATSPAETDPPTEPTIPTENTVPTETIPPAADMSLVENGSAQYKIVSLLSDNSPAIRFAAALQQKTGVKFEVVKEENAGDHAIYIGTPDQLAGKDGVSAKPAYTAYEVRAVAGNIYVSISMENFAEAMLDQLGEFVMQTADNDYALSKGAFGVQNILSISAIVPEFITSSGVMLEPYESGSGNYQIVYQSLNLTKADQEVANYEQALLAAGYTIHQENEINRNRFVTYINGDTMVHCNYFKTMREFRIIYGPKTYLGSAAPITDYEKKVTPSISIVGATDSVLCMVYQAPDGSFVIIDGGYGKNRVYNWTMNDGTADEMTYTINRNVQKDMESLWSLLESKTPAGQKPQVTWMMSHGDPDHIGLPPVFIAKYKDKFDLNLVCYNFPIIANVGLKNGEGPEVYQAYIDTFINSVITYFPNAQHMVFHTGQNLYLPGTQIEFLYSSEDQWPNEMPWMNDTCNAWRIISEGKSILITADVDAQISSQMVSIFGNHLKSDILQLNHHGSTGGSLALYKIVDPDVAFWACEDNRFLYDHQRLGTKSGFEYNKYIREAVQYHYAGSSTHTILLPSLEEEK